MQNAENILFTTAMAGYFAAMACSFLFVAIKKETPARISFVLQCVSLILHTTALVLRGLQAGRVPMTNQYEFAACFAWALCLVCIVFIRKYRFRALGVFTMPVVFLVMGYAAMQSRDIKPLMPALQSGWLVFHVSTAIISYGAFGVSAALGSMYLLRGKMKKDGFMDQHIPAEGKLDLIAYRSVCLGLLFLTFTIITGAIWAERAWGSYWSWDPKETWSLVTWIIYAAYLHLRLRKGWKGKAAAVFAVTGFICVIFTYIGVNTLLPGVHSYV